MASDSPAKADTLSGLTPMQAQEYHKLFMMTFFLFTGIATVAHLLVWVWRPWIPGTNGWESSALESATTFAATFSQFLA